MIKIVYQHDSNGYYLGETNSYNGLLPVNTVEVKPPSTKKGYIPRWNKIDKKWEHVESHIGETVFIDNKPFDIKEHGPYPEGSTKVQEFSIEELKSRYHSRLNRSVDDYIKSNTKTYSDFEKSTWQIQLTEAKEWINNSNIPTPNLDILMSSGKYTTKESLISKVITKNDEYNKFTFELLNKRKVIESVINNATLSTIEKIKWDDKLNLV